MARSFGWGVGVRRKRTYRTCGGAGVLCVVCGLFALVKKKKAGRGVLHEAWNTTKKIQVKNAHTHTKWDKVLMGGRLCEPMHLDRTCSFLLTLAVALVSEVKHLLTYKRGLGRWGRLEASISLFPLAQQAPFFPFSSRQPPFSRLISFFSITMRPPALPG